MNDFKAQRTCHSWVHHIILVKHIRLMKKDIHPKNYRLVVFEDLNDGNRILTRSTVKTEETTKWEDGNEYPLVKLEVSNVSHPYYTGKQKLLDTAGRIDKFNKKYKK